jgi:hypothetical protein
MFAISPFIANGQDIPSTTEQQLESVAEIDLIEPDDDSYVQQLEYLKRRPLDLNDADANQIKELMFVTDLQIHNLFSYRNLLGKFISVYELQAIPGWDISTIKKILPYITLGNAVTTVEDIKTRFANGDHGLLIRLAETLEKAKGFDQASSVAKYLGGRERVFLRYRYKYKNLLQFGISADKDAGEQFFKGRQRYGFDFYSLHLFARKIRKIQALALGDFTVNLGQGLIQWLNLGFKKSVDITGIKRQSAILRPYNSSGEFYFSRGAGMTLQTGKFETTAFISFRKISANFVRDTINNQNVISSFLNSGYHRTQSELDDKNNLQQFSFGGNLTYRDIRWHLGINAISHNFSLSMQKANEPSNIYSISGKNWANLSVDYSYTYHNLHFFGELAVDKNLDKAFVNGLMLSVDPRVDLSLVQRTISAKYQAVYGNAFTENTNPNNEIGLFFGITVRPDARWRLDAYADYYKFPWLKYLVDAPSYGTDFLAQLTFTPNKQLEVYSRFRSEAKQVNQVNNMAVTNYLIRIPKQGWRTQWTYRIDRAITVRSRFEVLWFDNRGVNIENGFLTFFDFIYKPLLKPYSGNIRLQYFETGGYNSRIYAYENDLRYSSSVPAFFDKGYRYYINVNYDVRMNLSLCLRWGQMIYREKESIGSGLDEIPGNHRSDLKLQAMLSF